MDFGVTCEVGRGQRMGKGQVKKDELSSKGGVFSRGWFPVKAKIWEEELRLVE